MFIKITFIIPISWTKGLGKLLDLRSVSLRVICMLHVLVSVDVYKHGHVEARVQAGYLSVIAPHFYFLRQSVSLNMKHSDSSRSAHQ